MGVGNLAHFMHKRTLFFLLTALGLKPEQGGLSPSPPLHFNHCLKVYLKPGFHPNAIACVACVACVAFVWKPG